MRGRVIKLFLIAAVLVITAASLFSQSKPICDYCKKPIAGKYLTADGKTYHPEHFLCAKCGKPISGEYIVKDKKYYHPACYSEAENLICDYCKKAILGDYVLRDGKKYHQNCYESFILQKCAVCGEPLSGPYYIDSYGNKYHSSHLSESFKCDYCDRLICQKLTGGGKSLSDGRHICNICYATAVFNQSDIEDSYKRVSRRLIDMGLNLDIEKIKIIGADRTTLKNKAPGYTNQMQGYCNSTSVKDFINNKFVKQTYSHTIYVLNGMPEVSLEGAIAHELMHSWLYENTPNNHPDNIREGACNYIAYLYLKSVPPRLGADWLKKLENDTDPVYGGGLRLIKSRFENKFLVDLLNFLKK